MICLYISVYIYREKNEERYFMMLKMKKKITTLLNIKERKE